MSRYGMFMADIDRTRTRSHGIINYAIGLVTAMAEQLDPTETLVVLGNDGVIGELTDAGGALPGCELVSLPRPSGIRDRLVLEEIHLSRIAAEHHLDLLHFPKGMLPLRRPKRVPTVVTIHDDIPLQYLRGRFGTRRPLLKNSYVAMRMVLALRRADVVLTVSEFSAAALRRYARRANPIVVGEGVGNPGHRPDVRRDTSADTRYAWFFYSSQLEHKNCAWTLGALAGFAARSDAGRLPVVVGPLPRGFALPPSWEHEPGPLSNDKLNDLVTASEAMIYSSLYEGFGLPPLEAWRLGVPAVFPLLPPLSETIGDLPGGYAPGDVGSLAEALAAATSLAPEERSRIQGLVLDRTSWHIPATRTLQAYRDLVSR